MRISDYAIKHPAVITILIIALTVFGLLAAASLNQALIAGIEMPALMVVTPWPGVGPEDIESDVTEVLEAELGTIEGLNQMTSVSRNSISMITLELDYGESSDEKLPDIREKINLVSADLPEELPGPPKIFQFSASNLPVMTILASGSSSEESLSRFCRDEVVPALSRIPGVASASLMGEVTESLEIRVDISSLNGRGVSLMEIYQVLEASNIALPGGDVVYQGYNLNVRTNGRFESVEEVENLVVAFRGGTAVYLKELADVGIRRGKPDSYVISDGVEVLSITLDKKKDADTIAISREASEVLAGLESAFEGAWDFEILIDDADKIDAAVGTVINSALLGALLAVFILLLFLHNARTTIIVSVSIPLSLLFTMIGMRFAGLTINMITLGGMTTAIGMIVDSSIVVLENIHRHLKEGLSPKEAASLGAREVGGAVVASTSTSLAVFIPILFLSGLTGLILKDVAWTIVFSLFSSLIVAVVVVPYLSGLLLKSLPPGGDGSLGLGRRISGRIEIVMEALSRSYGRLLSRVLRDKGFFLIVTVVLLVMSGISFRLLGFEFLEQTDMAEIQISIETPGGYTLEMTREKVLEIEELVKELVPELESSVFYVGRGGTIVSALEPNRAFGTLSLSRVRERKRHVMDIIPVLREEIPRRIPDVDVDVANGGVSALLALATGGEGVVIEVYGSDLDKVVQGAEIVQGYMDADQNVLKSDVNIRFNNREMVSNLVYNSMGQLGIVPYEAAVTTRILFNGVDAGTFDTDDGSVPVILNTNLTGAELPPDLLNNLNLTSLGGSSVSFSNFTDFKLQRVLSSLSHRNRSLSVLVSSTLKDPNVRETSRRVTEALRVHGLPPGVRWRASGSSAEMMDSFRSLILVMIIAVFLVYAVMVIQFERFSQPLVVMTSVPFTMIGVVLSLLLFGSSLSLVSFMGIIALAGIVVNNAIVLIDYINLLRRDGLELLDAVRKGAGTRLKPILMTTLTTILGVLPLAIGMGEGAEIYSPLGQAIAGGLVTSTFITLLLVPVLYYIIEKRKEKRSNLIEEPRR